MVHALPFPGILIAQSGSEGKLVRELTSYEWSRLAQFDDPRWLWMLVATAALLLAAYVVWFYRRERASLPRTMRWVFPFLRLVAVGGVVFYFLGLEKRVDQQVVSESQVVVLVDTSQSMSVSDEGDPDNRRTRGQAVVETLQNTPLLAALRQKNNVALQSFDRDLRRLAAWPRVQITTNVATTSEPEASGVATASTPSWAEQLLPHGPETRLGTALTESLKRAGDDLLAGIVIISDGVQNSGVDAQSFLEQADADVPVFTVGVGSTSPRRNVRIQELSAPARVYPEDRTTVTGIVQGEGLAGKMVTVELYAREADNTRSVGAQVGTEQITFDEDGQFRTVQFQIEPAAVGRLALEMRVAQVSEDQYPGDNRREVEIEVVEARNRVLLIAGAASRDYQFLRNQLYRDRHASVDVWIQSASSGISQEADQILFEFPSTKEELYQYDCIVAFDPNWELLDARQADMLETWVAEEAGGMIVVAGPIHTASWTQNPELAKVRSLYPVEFQRRLTLLDDGLYGSKTPWPILFTDEGEDADFLGLSDDPLESQNLWTDFPGIYGCYAVRGPKPGARVLGRYGDPEASLSEEYPVYFAEQFYGSGRVFYMGSSELWRLRAMDPGYFEVLTTRLIRHVSQGRLLKGSSRGRLLVEQDRYSVGDDVVVRAQLLSESREPLVVPQVTARVVGPEEKGENLDLMADSNRAGSYVGQFTVKAEGSYRIELSVPDALDERLVRRIQVTVPDLEFDETRRNESLLSDLAEQTGGRYYPTLASMVEGDDELPPLAELLQSRAETRVLRGAPDTDFTRTLNLWLLGVICGALCLEWLLRRLMKLA